MAVFRYTGRDLKGRMKKGRVTAENRKEAVTLLKEKGIAVSNVDELTGFLYKEINLTGNRVKHRDLVLYIRQFSTLLKAGIPLVETTKILSDQTSSKVLKKSLADVAESLEKGQPFSDAAEKHRKVFPSIFINMVRAGEAGGNLDEILERLANYFEKQHETRQKVRSAMTYPIVVGVIAIVIVIFLLSTVVPQFASMFESFGGELPLITKIVMSLGDSVKRVWWLFILAIVGVVFLIRYLRSNKRTKYLLDHLILRIPVFGPLLLKAALARMTRTLSSLFSSSVPILQSLAIVEKVIGNEVLADVLKQARVHIEKGQSMTIPMEKHWAFPPMVIHMITVGEKSGTLDSMLEKVADFYEMEVDRATEQMKSLIEPMMIVVLSFIVGGIVASIAIPMFKVFETIQ